MNAFGRFSEKELKEAFDLVANKKNWKLPIRKIIPREKIEIVTAAVLYYTGGVPYFLETNKEEFVKVVASGYYNIMGS